MPVFFTQHTMNPNASLKKVLSWFLVVIYTIALPHAIIVYDYTNERFSREFTASIPSKLMLFLTVVFVAYGIWQKRDVRIIKILFGIFLLVAFVIYIEPNSNKHIHVPEYALLAWLLYFALSLEYNGRGIYCLIFLCGSMLGVVDELQQGLHPNRYYGSSDMLVNSISSLVGVLTLLYLRKNPTGKWDWLSMLGQHRRSFIILFISLLGAVISCVRLFKVAEENVFWEVYPGWLVTGNIILLILGLLLLGYYFWPSKDRVDTPSDSILLILPIQSIVRLWIVLPLAILCAIHALIGLIAFSGLPFQ